MIIYPLSAIEEQAVRWVSPVAAVMAVVTTLFLGAISLAAAAA